MSVKGWKIRQKGIDLNSEVMIDFDKQGFVGDDGKDEKVLGIHGVDWSEEINSQVNMAISPPSEEMAELIFKGVRFIMPGESFFSGTSYWRNKLEALCSPKPLGVGIEYGGFWGTLCWPVYYGKIHHPRFQGRILDKISQQLEKVEFDPTLLRLAMNNIMDLYFMNKEGVSFARVMDISFAKTADGVAFSVAGAVSGDPLVRTIRGLIDRPEGKYWMGSLLEPLLNGVDLDVRIHPAGGLEIQGRVPFWRETKRGELIIQDLRNLKGAPAEPGLILTKNIIRHFGDFGDKVQRELHVIEKRIIQKGEKVKPPKKAKIKIVEKIVEVEKKKKQLEKKQLKKRQLRDNSIFDEPSIGVPMVEDEEGQFVIPPSDPELEENTVISHWDEESEHVTIIQGEAQKQSDGFNIIQGEGQIPQKEGFNVIQGSGYEKEVQMMLGTGSGGGYESEKREQPAWVIPGAPTGGDSAGGQGGIRQVFVVPGGGSVEKTQTFTVHSGEPVKDLGDNFKMVIPESSQEVEIVTDPELLAKLRKAQIEIDTLLLEKMKLEDLAKSKDGLSDTQSQQLKDKINELTNSLQDKEVQFRDARQAQMKAQAASMSAQTDKSTQESLEAMQEMRAKARTEAEAALARTKGEGSLVVKESASDKAAEQAMANEKMTVSESKVQDVKPAGLSEEDKAEMRKNALDAKQKAQELERMKKQMEQKQKQIDIERERFKKKLEEQENKAQNSAFYSGETQEQKTERIEREKAIKQQEAELQRLSGNMDKQKKLVEHAETKREEDQQRREKAETTAHTATVELEDAEAEIESINRESETKEREFNKDLDLAKGEMNKLEDQVHQLQERLLTADPEERKQLEKEVEHLITMIKSKEKIIEATQQKINDEIEFRHEQNEKARTRIIELEEARKNALQAQKSAEMSDVQDEQLLRNKVKELTNLLDSRDKMLERGEKVMNEVQEKNKKQVKLMLDRMDEDKEEFEKGKSEVGGLKMTINELTREVRANELSEDQKILRQKNENKQLASEITRKEGLIEKIQQRFTKHQDESSRQQKLLKSQLDDERHKARELGISGVGADSGGMGAGSEDSKEIKRLITNVDGLKKENHRTF